MFDVEDSSVQPASRYEAERRHGFLSLVFSPEIEREYQAWSQRHQVVPALVCAAMALVVWLGFAAYDFVRLDFFERHHLLETSHWFLLGTRWTVAVLLVLLLANAKWLTKHLAFAASGVYLAIGVGAAITSHIYTAHGIPRSDTALLIVVMAAFLPMGLTFYQAVAAALLVIGVAAVSGMIILPHDSGLNLGYLVFITAVALLFGGIGGYLREYSRREQFLLRQLLHSQAQFDPLTNLANRRMLARRAKKALAHARREDEPAVFAVLDVDYFKPYNDLYGHGAGDMALMRIAAVLRQATRRPMDLAARIGGEEFAIFLYNTDIGDAGPVFNRIIDEIAALGIDHAGSPVGNQLTVSIGAAAFTGGEDLDALYARADAFLYAAKDAGRNRVVLEGAAASVGQKFAHG